MMPRSPAPSVLSTARVNVSIEWRAFGLVMTIDCFLSMVSISSIPKSREVARTSGRPDKMSVGACGS